MRQNGRHLRPLQRHFARFEPIFIGNNTRRSLQASSFRGLFRPSLARALALDPEILFLDEPTSGLDPVGAAAFDELILTLHNALNLTVFLVTHDLDSLYAICNRVAVLSNRRVVVADRIDVVEAYPDPWIQACFCGPRARGARVEKAVPIAATAGVLGGNPC